MAIGDVYRLSVEGQFAAGAKGFVTFHVRFKSVSATPSGAATLLTSYLLNNLAGYLSSSWTFQQVNWLSENLTPPISGSVVPATWPKVGTRAYPLLPYPTAWILTLRTGFAGRSYRGRAYICGLGEDLSDGSTVNGTEVTNLQSVCNTWVGAWGSGGTDPDYELIVWSKKLNAGTPVTAIVVRSTLGTQRRRRPGVGV